MCVAARQAEYQCKTVICGDQLDYGVPSAAQFPNRLRPDFLGAPLLSGWALTLVLSRPRQSLDTRVIWCSWRASKKPIQNAGIRPATHPGVDRVPFAETLRQSPPLATVLGDKQDGVDHHEVRNPHIPALSWKIGWKERALLLCYLFHNKYLI